MATRIKKGDPEMLLVSFCDILTISISALFMATIVTVFEATKVPELTMTPKTITTDKQPVFFECRSNELFAVDLGRLQDQVADALSRADPVTKSSMADMIKVIQARQITNEYYRVNANYLLTGMVALEPRAFTPGESIERINDQKGKYQYILSQLNPAKQYIAFLVRDNSFLVFRRAREIADKVGFDVGWELLGSDEAIKFGAGGANIRVGG